MQISKTAHTIPLIPKMKRPPEKFWQLADAHLKFLYNIALRYTGNRYDAEDLVQETFYVGFKKFYQLREERKFKSWLFAILRNTHLKNGRQKGKLLKSEYEDGIDYIRFWKMRPNRSMLNAPTSKRSNQRKFRN
jgi:RNA polymerase sigma factor (sigma-70 family)